MPREIFIPKIGPPEVLAGRQTTEIPLVRGQVRVRVAAAGVNFADISARMGTYSDAPSIPFTPGYEVGGWIEEVGPGAPGYSVGAPVCALTRFGGYADQVVVEANQVFPLPPGLDPVRAAAVPVTHLTAHVCLFEAASLRSGQTVLVLGGAGGVGTAAVQMAQARGIRVLATAGGPGKCEWLQGLGVDRAIDHMRDDVPEAVRDATGGHGVDAVLDPIGGRGIRTSLAMCAPLGRVVLFGASAMNPGKTRSLRAILREVPAMRFFNAIDMIHQNVGLHGVNMLHLADEMPDRYQEWMQDIAARIVAGELDPVIAERFPLDAEGAAAAHHYIQDRKNIGKVLLVTGAAPVSREA